MNVEKVEQLVSEAYHRGWREGCETLIEANEIDGAIAYPHKDAENEGAGTFMGEIGDRIEALAADRPEEDRELVARLRELRVVLKSGDFDGADLMSAWCAMMDAADRIESSYRIEGMREALETARRYVERVALGEGTMAEKVVAESDLNAIDAALKAEGLKA